MNIQMILRPGNALTLFSSRYFCSCFCFCAEFLSFCISVSAPGLHSILYSRVLFLLLFLFYFPSVAVCSFLSFFIFLFLLLFSGPYYVSCSLCFFFCFWFCYCAAFCSFFFLSFWFCLCDLLCFSFSFCFMHRWIRIEVCSRCV
jgi:hypothetical protein